MALITDYLVQGGQMLLILLLAPLLTGWVRAIKARLLRRRGPSLLQPYRDLLKLLRKDVVLAESASWLFRVAPCATLVLRSTAMVPSTEHSSWVSSAAVVI